VPSQSTTLEAEPTNAPARRRWTSSRVRIELLGAAISAALALAGVTAVLRLWKAHLNIPIASGGDVMLSLMVVKNMQTTGWYQSTPDLGAPFGQDLTAYPSSVGDFWHMATLKVLSLFMTPAGTVNVFFIGCFAVIAVVAYACLRLLSVSRPFAAVLGAVYTFLPYHFLRGEYHLLLSAYYAVPIAVVLGVGLYNGRLTLRANPKTMTRLGWAAVACAVLLAGTGLYYAVFGMLMLATGGILGSLARRAWRPLLSGAALAGIIGLGLVAGAIPNLLHHGPPGSVSAVEGRSYGATEFYGLKITNLLLPSQIHRIAKLAHLRAHTADSLIPGEGTETLGILGVIGLVAIVLAVMLPALERNSALVRRMRPLGALAVVSIICGTVAGLNGVLATLGFGEMRAWNRISVLIAFLALAGFGLLVDATRKRWVRGTPIIRRLAVASVAGVVFLVGLYDLTSPQVIPDYPAAAATWNSDATFFAQVQGQFGAGAAVFELPYARFPENPPIANMTDYSHLRGYLHSDLHWSYGGVKNEQSEWQPVALRSGIGPALPELVTAGFSAIYVNQLGYGDAGAQIESEIVSVIGTQAPLVSPDGTLKVYDLRPYAARLAASGAPLPTLESVLYPVTMSYGATVYGVEASGTDTWHWAPAVAELTLANPSPHEAKVMLRGTVRVMSSNATIIVRIGDQETRFTPIDGGVVLDLPITVQPGSEIVRISTDSGQTPSAPNDLRDLRQQLLNFDLTPITDLG
jgi:phosphoglycerol transferase